MSTVLETILISREDNSEDVEEVEIDKNDRVLNLLKLAKDKLYPGKQIAIKDLHAYNENKSGKFSLTKSQRISDITDLDLIVVSHKPHVKIVEQTEEKKKDNITIWAARETLPDASEPIEIDRGKTVYDLLTVVKDKLFPQKSLPEIHAVDVESKTIIERHLTIQVIAKKRTKFLFRVDANAQENAVEKLKFDQEEELEKLKEARKKIEDMRGKVTTKTLDGTELIKNLNQQFGLKDIIQETTTRKEIEQLLKDLENDVKQEESKLENNAYDFSTFSPKDRCQELMSHINGNCATFEIEQPILSNVTKEKDFKLSSEELFGKTNNNISFKSTDRNVQIGVEAAVPVKTFCNVSTLRNRGSGMSSSYGGGTKDDNIQRAKKATVSKRHTQQIMKFKIAKTSISAECKKDAEKLGKVCQNTENEEKNEKELLDFLDKYPEQIYTGPYGAGGWFEFVTTVESSENEDITKLQNEAMEQNKSQSEIAANIKIAGLGGGGLAYGNESSGQDENSNATMSTNKSSKYTKSTTFVCKGPQNIRTPSTLTARLTSPNNWAVFPSCDEENPSSLFTPIYELIRNAGEETDDKILKIVASELETILKNGTQYFIGEPNIVNVQNNKVKNIMMFGKTGQGKSLLGNVILGEYDAFTVGEGTSSCTKDSKQMLNEKRGVRIHDTYGLADTADTKLGMHYLAGSQRAMKAILDAWEGIGTDGLDAVLLVQKRGSKVTAEDAALAKYAKEKLFGSNIGKRTFLVLTESAKTQLFDESAQKKFLTRESSSGSHFADIFKLVDSDSNRVLFVNNQNPNPEECGGREDVIKAKRDNIIMAEKVLNAIHNNNIDPVKTPIHELETRRIEVELEMLKIIETRRAEKKSEMYSTKVDSFDKLFYRLAIRKNIRANKMKLIDKFNDLGLKVDEIPPELSMLIKELKEIEETKKREAKSNMCNIL